MPGTVVTGAQWGDEGKGKIVDFMATNFRLFARYNGGPNAGHTIQRGDLKIATHQLPSPVLYPRRTLFLGRGMAVDPAGLLKEIEDIKRLGGLEDATIYVDPFAHVILERHREVDRERNKHIGTTGRGIGPCYEDRVGRRGVRFTDVLRGGYPELDALVGELKKYVTFVDTSKLLHEKLSRGYPVLFEGAQGVLLDVDYGTYPFVTSSSTLPQNAAVSCALPMHFFSRIIGVTKAYTTRVGAGPFPTELHDATGEQIRKVGKEFGATTGRPRRCGWLDIPALRYAVRVAGLQYFALTKLDVLSGMGIVKMCVAYKMGDALYDELPVHEFCEGTREQPLPVYEEHRGWASFLQTKYFSDLPDNARAFIRRIEELTGVKALIISTGPDSEATICTDGAALIG